MDRSFSIMDMTFRRRLRIAAFGLACLGVASSAPALDAPVRSEVLLGFRPGTSSMIRSAITAMHGGRTLAHLDAIDAALVSVDLPLESALASFARHPAVAYAEANTAGTLAAGPPSAPNDPTWNAAEHWRLRRMNAPAGWQVWPGRYFTAATKPRTAIKIAVLDGRIDAAHPDFRNASGSSTDARAGGQLDLADRRDIVPANRQAGPADWHGTFIAGLLGAATNNNRNIAGVAYGAQLMPVVVADGNGVVTAADASAGILHATGRGAKVINMSFSMPATSATLKRAVERAAAAGAVMVAAAGNSSNNKAVYPAAYARDHASVIAVSASSILDTIAYCSNHNSYITVAAPGTDLLSLAPGGGTKRMACGTSASTALVSGVAASIAARVPGIAPAAIRDRIARTADDIEAPGRDTFSGSGRINMQRALWVAPGPAARAARPVAAGKREGTTIVAVASSSRGIAGAEFSIDRIAPPGRGIAMGASDRAWGGTTERLGRGYNTRNLSEGLHEVFVRARDRDGRWGPAAVAVLVVDRTAPSIFKLEVQPAVVVPGDKRTRLVLGVGDLYSRTMNMSIAFIDATDVSRATFRYRLPSALYRAVWAGTMDPPASPAFNRPALPPGPYTVRVTAIDEAGHVSTAETKCTVTADPRIPEDD